MKEKRIERERDSIRRDYKALLVKWLYGNVIRLCVLTQ